MYVLVGLCGSCFSLDFDFDFELNFFEDWDFDLDFSFTGCEGGTPGKIGHGRFLFEQFPVRDHRRSPFAVGTTQRFAVRTPEGETPTGLSVETEESPSVLEVLPDETGLAPFGVRFLAPGAVTFSLRDAQGELWEQVDLWVVEPRALGVQVGSAAPDRSDPLLPTEDATGVLLAPGGDLRVFATLLGAEGEPLLGVFRATTTGTERVSALAEGMVPSNRVGWTEQASLLFTETGLAAGDAADLLVLHGPGGATGTLQVQVVETPSLAALEGHVHRGEGAFKPRDGTRVAVWGRTAGGILAFGYAIRFTALDPTLASVTPDPARPDAALVSFHRPGTAEIRAAYEADSQVSMTFTFTVLEPVDGSAKDP